MDLETFLDRAAQGQIFTVEFVKRTTGELRTMNCRTGVKKHLAGGEAAYDARSKGLLFVYDLDKAGYRSVNLEDLKSLRMGSESYIWEAGAFVPQHA